ncbi:MAG: hypothetical protein GXO83_06510 [Chlorobi bacterium]|nr:hypothetical protein [Chlorobiota bacterium]
MKKLLSYILYGMLWSISLLPFPVLYFLSDLLFPLVYYVFRYRRAVVYRNLEKSFPEKSQAERITIQKKFYHHLCDVMVESVKLITYPAEKLLNHIDIVNPDILETYRKAGRHGIMSSGHYANWEWLIVFPFVTKYHAMAVYKPLHDKVMDRLILRSRTKGIDKLIPMHKTLRAIAGYHRDQIPTLSLFVADQTPIKEETEYFTWFLNQETAAFTGVEKIARKFDEAVFFFKMNKIKRGKYRLEILEITSRPKEEAPYAITERYFKMLESCIRERPELWLWSHKRWKFDSGAVPNRKILLSPEIQKNKTA